MFDRMHRNHPADWRNQEIDILLLNTPQRRFEMAQTEYWMVMHHFDISVRRGRERPEWMWIDLLYASQRLMDAYKATIKKIDDG